MIFFSGCRTQVQPAIVPAVEVPQVKQTKLGVIGAVEPVYFLPMKSPFEARIDTGAENSSVDVTSLKTFERDGEKWVSFNITNRKDGSTHHFEKPIKRHTTIVRIGEHEERYVVNMTITIGNETIKADFTLANRDKFNYQVLIGRNIINGRFIIDPTLENTMH